MKESSSKSDNSNEFSEHINPDNKRQAGRLKIFFGYAAGAGKTYAMLDDAGEQFKSGIDVIIGFIDPHTRPETLKLLNRLPVLPPKILINSNIKVKEFDLDSALKRKPHLIIVDQLDHSNAEGVRNKKRYQDIEELLNAGIDVYTTVDVQHIESLNDIIREITKISVKETIPDYIFENADKVKFIDVEPEELMKRFEEGKLFSKDETGLEYSFFSKNNLRLLREIAMRKATDRISSFNQRKNKTLQKSINTRFLVCISPSPSSAKCIRWAARTSEAFHAPWTALYVETPECMKFSEDQIKTVRSHMDLAERLGAKVVTLGGNDVASVVSEYTKYSGITNIVIGKSRQRSIKSLFVKSFEDKLISLLKNIEIHIIPDSDNTKPYKNKFTINLSRNLYLSFNDFAKTFALLISVTLFSYGIKAIGVGEQNVIMFYILSVLIISRITSGYLYGILASFLSVLIFTFLFVEPYYTFTALQPDYPITFVIILFAALTTSALIIRIKTKASLAAERERRTEVLYEINKKLLVTRGLDNIIEAANEYVNKLFDRTSILYLEDPVNGKEGIIKKSREDKDTSYMLSDKEKEAVHWVFLNKKRAGNGTDTFMEASGFYTPIISQGNVLGVLGISCNEGNFFGHNNRSLSTMIASLVAMALERQYLSDEQRRILIEAEKEKMRSNLLRAISHDLRTPLTGILGASSAILENKGMDIETHDKLIGGIKEDSQWLIRMVENLLSVTRISDGSMGVVKTPEAAEEIVAEAVSRIRTRFEGCRINVKVPEELLLIPMDGTLIEQVIINLLENAVKHTAPNTVIDLNVKKADDTAVFEVSDNGAGIPKEDLAHIFEGFAVSKGKSSDSSRGMGIGLSLCNSIINAHNGKIEAENKKEGGAVFRFILPLEGVKYE